MTLTMRFARASLWMESNNVKGHMCFGVCLLPTTLSEWPCIDIELQGMDVLVFFFPLRFFFPSPSTPCILLILLLTISTISTGIQPSLAFSRRSGGKITSGNQP